MALFRIDYMDPEERVMKTVEQEFEYAAGILASEWAADLGYTLADKGPYTVTQIA